MADRKVTVQMDVKEGDTRGLRNITSQAKSFAEHLRATQKEHFRVNAPSPVPVKFDAPTMKALLAPVARGVAGVGVGQALGAGVGGLVGGAALGGPVAAGAAAVIEMTKTLSTLPLRVANWKMEKQVRLVEAYGSSLGAAGVALEKSRQRNDWLPDFLHDIWKKRVDLQKQQMERNIGYAGVASPGLARRQELASLDLQAAIGVRHKGDLEGITRQTRLLADVELMQSKFGRSNDPRIKELKEQLEKNKVGLSAEGAAGMRRQFEEAFGGKLPSSVGLAAKPANFMGGEEYAKSVYQAAFQSGVDPATLTAENTADMRTMLRQIAGQLGQLLTGNNPSRNAIENGR
jgi:hypothetical protein